MYESIAMVCGGSIERVLVIAFLVAITGCAQRGGNATGGGTIAELMEKYEAAHRERNIEKLRDILWWESPQVASRHREDLEELMTALFVVELDKVEFVEGLDPKAIFGGRTVSYVRRRPGKRRQVCTVGGPVYGKLVLVGSVTDARGKRAVRVDPSYVVMQSINRYYIDIHEFVVEDAVISVRTGAPSRSEPLPLDADPSKVPRDW
jgi:hypothetical protein